MNKRRFDLQDGEIYSYTKDKGFTLHDPFSFKYKGFDIKSLYEHYLDKKQRIKKQKNAIEHLKTLLLELEVITNEDLLYIASDIENLVSALTTKLPDRVINPDAEYMCTKTDENGYVIDFNTYKGNNIQKNKNAVRDEIKRGLWQIKDGKLIKDTRKEVELWNL